MLGRRRSYLTRDSPLPLLSSRSVAVRYLQRIMMPCLPSRERFI